MRFVLFCQSIISDWNHGNAHFLRGVVRDLRARGHGVRVLEPVDGWSRTSLLADQGEAAEQRYHAVFPDMRPVFYDLACPSVVETLDEALDGADVVIVHEWSEPLLVRHLSQRRRGGGRFRLLFHDTHHRAATLPAAMAAYDLSAFDGVLAFGEAVRDLYLRHGWTGQAWTWHEAADIALFRPLDADKEGDLVWIGNWGDDERTAELEQYLFIPIRTLGLSAHVHGVRYPAEARAALAAAGIVHGGWRANYEVPAIFARHRITVHVPRRPYVQALPGIPTIRVFEALACGIPLVSAPWSDSEGLFRIGSDFLMARDGIDMIRHVRDVLHDRDLARSLVRNGLDTIRARHTCTHRVDELLAICRQLGAGAALETA